MAVHPLTDVNNFAERINILHTTFAGMERMLSPYKSPLAQDAIHDIEEKTVVVEKEFYNIVLKQGLDLLELYKFHDAIDVFNKMIECLNGQEQEQQLKPILAKAYAQKGIALCQGGHGKEDEDMAYQCLKQALLIDPSLQEAKIKLMAMKYDREEIIADDAGFRFKS
jgi:tetratricopeptide (TPR) repeat protein